MFTGYIVAWLGIRWSEGSRNIGRVTYNCTEDLSGSHLRRGICREEEDR